MSEFGPEGDEGKDFIAPTNNESGTEQEKNEPTSAEIIQFIETEYADILDKETLVSIKEEFQGDFDDACGYLLTTLLENGVDEEQYFQKLAEKGINL